MDAAAIPKAAEDEDRKRKRPSLPLPKPSPPSGPPPSGVLTEGEDRKRMRASLSLQAYCERMRALQPVPPSGQPPSRLLPKKAKQPPPQPPPSPPSGPPPSRLLPKKAKQPPPRPPQSPPSGPPPTPPSAPPPSHLLTPKLKQSRLLGTPCPWGNQCNEKWKCEYEHPGTPQKVLQELRRRMAEASGTCEMQCTFGRACKNVDCVYIHEERRSIEEDPEALICKFNRKCMRPDCFYVHPKGREIDEDASHDFSQHCSNSWQPGYFQKEYPQRIKITPGKITPGKPAHFKEEKKKKKQEEKCPQRAGSYIRCNSFPEDWKTEGAEALAQRIASYFITEDLLGMPRVSQDCSSAVAHFVSPSATNDAVQSLTIVEIPFSFDYHHDEFHDDDASEGSQQIFSVKISNISPAVEEAELKELFEMVGVVHSCKIHGKSNNPEAEAYSGVCKFIDDSTMQAAIDILDGSEIQGKKIRVQVDNHSALVTDFPDEWSCLSPKEFVLRVKVSVKSIGDLASEPTILEDGLVRVEFTGKPRSKGTSLSNGSGILKLAPYLALKKQNWFQET